jgi:hypothetical protein
VTNEARLRGLQPGDVDALCEALRSADAAEVMAGGEATGADGVRFAVEASDVAWALEHDGQVGALFGVRAVEPGRLVLWMLTASIFGEQPRPFVRAIRRNLPWLRRLGDLFNFIDGRYTGALRLAASLGATFGSPIDRNGYVFVPFQFRRL